MQIKRNETHLKLTKTKAAIKQRLYRQRQKLKKQQEA